MNNKTDRTHTIMLSMSLNELSAQSQIDPDESLKFDREPERSIDMEDLQFKKIKKVFDELNLKQKREFL